MRHLRIQPNSVAVLAAFSICVCGCAAKYSATGLVLRVDPAAATLTVSHDDVPGLMEAMVMPIAVRPGTRVDNLHPGDRIAFRLVVDNDSSHADRIQLLSASPADAGLLSTPAASTLTKIGDPVPDFSLTNQHGASVTLSSLRGKIVVATFIYTRCPLPDYCPRMIANLDAVRDRFESRLGKEIVLLTISFDPQYDTPERLLKFARAHQADVAGWHFLTGTAQGIKQVCDAFGVEYWPDSGLITHTLQTAVIDQDGRLAATVEGKGFTGTQLSDLVQVVLDW